MGIGDILDATFKLYARNFLAFSILAWVPYLPLTILGLVMFPDLGEVDLDEFRKFGFLITLLLVFVAMPICQGALTYHISSSFLGKQISIAEALKRGLSRAFPLVIAGIISGFVIMFGFLLLIVPGVIFTTWFMLTGPVLILERKGPTDAMSRSKQLIGGNRGKGLSLLVILVIFQFIFNFAIQFVFQLVLPNIESDPLQLVVRFVFGLFSALILPIQTAPAILLYYDLRTRKEGFDLEHLASSMAQEGSGASSGDGSQASS